VTDFIHILFRHVLNFVERGRWYFGGRELCWFDTNTFYAEWSRKNCTKFNASPFCNRLHAVFTKMLRKHHCLPVNAKFVSGG